MLDEVISRSLERHPEQRFQSAAELRQALEEALREPELQRRRRRRMGFATLGAVVIALGGLGYAGYKKPDVRARALAMAQPVLHKVEELRQARAAARGAALDEAKPPATPAKSAAAPEKKSQPAAPAAPVVPAQDKPVDALARADEPAAPATPAPAQDEALEKRIAASVQLMESGNKLKGYNQLRDLGQRNAQNPSALKAWGQAAVAMRAWGEALHVARLWSKVDPGVDSGLNLARMLRRTGHRDEAVRALAALVKAHPESDQARSMLGAMGGQQQAVAQN